MDWTEDRAIFDLVESLHVPSFTWDEVEAQPFSWSGWGLAFWA